MSKLGQMSPFQHISFRFLKFLSDTKTKHFCPGACLILFVSASKLLESLYLVDSLICCNNYNKLVGTYKYIIVRMIQD